MGSSEVSVWSVTDTTLSFLTRCLPGLCDLYRTSSLTKLHPDDALYINGAHVCRFKSKTLTEKLSTKDLYDKLPDEAYLQFRAGSESIV